MGVNCRQLRVFACVTVQKITPSYLFAYFHVSPLEKLELKRWCIFTSHTIVLYWNLNSHCKPFGNFCTLLKIKVILDIIPRWTICLDVADNSDNLHWFPGAGKAAGGWRGVDPLLGRAELLEYDRVKSCEAGPKTATYTGVGANKQQ